jgi:DNA-binding beta-propeller fold protein YncE
MTCTLGDGFLQEGAVMRIALAKQGSAGWVALLCAVGLGCGPEVGVQQAVGSKRATPSALGVAGGTPELPDATGPDYTLFEAGQVRPIAVSRTDNRLFAVNTPDDRLEIFRIQGTHLAHVDSLSVGLRPVSVAVRNEDEVWVVNHLSDSISIVNIRGAHPTVTRTLFVGDEPRDIVFAGPNRKLAFITTAHRGQNSPVNPQLTTPGVGRADVWVFDTTNLGAAAGGNPQSVITLFADTPRALATSPDGSRVYVAAFNSGNQTTTVDEAVTAPFAETNTAGEPQPHTGLIAKLQAGRWIDALGRDVTAVVNFSLPDHDVFTIDATGPVAQAITSPADTFAHVGTTLFNMAVNPVSGALYVSNTEANNHTRFEGPGLNPAVNTTVRGNIARSRITVIKNGAVTPIHLNKHIDYEACCAPVGNAEARKSLAFPRDMAVSSDGAKLYVTAFGSSKIGVFDTAALENDSFVPSESSHIALSGGGPTGLVLDEARKMLFVLTRFTNSISVVDLKVGHEVSVAAMHNPEPPSIVEGRPFLYDAVLSSSHGDSACASCHVDGDMDHLAWDLGDPTALLPDMPGTADGLRDILNDPFGNGTTAFALGLPKCSVAPPGTPPALCTPDIQFRFNSHKGPMTTQTLRGMANHGSMHWRGDRTVGEVDDPGAQPDLGMFDENAAFNAFNVAFPGLLGRDAQVPAAAMQKFAEFALQITLPPNPIRRLDNSLTPLQARGRAIYFGEPGGPRRTDLLRTCNGCHVLDPLANAQYGVERPGFFGSDGRFAAEQETQMFKIPHLRNAYQKVGMFGMAADRTRPFAQNVRRPFMFQQFMGPQIRGFGFLHDGAVDTVSHFIEAGVFLNLGPLQSVLSPSTPQNVGGFAPFIPPGTFPTNPAQLPPNLQFLVLLNNPFFQQLDPATGQPLGPTERAALEAFVLAFPSNLAPIVGQQITLTHVSQPDADARLLLLQQRAAVTTPVPECDLVAKSALHNSEIGYLYDPAQNAFLSSEGHTLSEAQLRQLLVEEDDTLTFTCVPPGSGVRMALDRDRDGYLDGL